MTHRIKTISNDIQGPVKAEPRDHAHHTSYGDSRQSNKILELEWEALGKKLNKQMDRPSDDELVNLQKQVRDKDEQLKYAERKIAELKRQLSALQEKQQPGNNPRSNVQHKPNVVQHKPNAVQQKQNVQNKPGGQNRPHHKQNNRHNQQSQAPRSTRPQQNYQGQGRK